jgi:cob(I)alamin adenosyltransferase
VKSDEKTKKGLIHIYTGNGKGKITAALGTALRAAGQGFNILILQFMKRQKNIGEIRILESTNLPIKIEQYGRRVFFKTRTCEPMDIYMAHKGLEAFQKAMVSGEYDVIVLDEINMAIHFGLLNLEEVIRAVEKKPPNLHLILTGRMAKTELIEIADLVTEMREIKHYFNRGVIAQKGLEY